MPTPITTAPRRAGQGWAGQGWAGQGWAGPFVALALVWGSSFAFVEIALRSLTPVQVATGRLLLGAVTLLVLSWATRTRLPRGARTWAHLAVVGLLLNAAPFTLFAYGQLVVSSVLAGIINAATPLMTLLVILTAFREEKPTPVRVLGLLTGFVGVLVVLGAWRGLGAGEWTGVLACLAAITCYGVAFPYSRRHLSGTGEPPIALAAGQVLTSSTMMLLPLAATGVTNHAPVTADVVVSMLLLGALGSGVAYVWNYRVVALAGASTASSVTYLTPVVAAVIGVGLLGEHLSWHAPVGGLVVLAGVALAQGRIRARQGMPA